MIEPCAENLDQYGLGDSEESWAYYGDDYWMVPFRHGESSSGPRHLPMWKPKDKVGVLLYQHGLSFYLNGKCIAPNAFQVTGDKFRFAVGFGGKSDPQKIGDVTILQPTDGTGVTKTSIKKQPGQK